MKGMLTLKKSVVLAAMCLAVLCVLGYSEPTPEQVKERTGMLIQAIGNNDVERVRLCIKLGADVNASCYSNTDSLYFSLISYAAYSGFKDIVELLVEAGADVNARGRGISVGYAALVYAVDKGCKDTVELLIKSGANVNAIGEGKNTALMVAVEKGHKDIAELLIKAGADVNKTNRGDYTALMYAAEKGHKDIARMLIETGADLNAKDRHGSTALMYADKDIAEMLIKTKNVDIKAISNNGSTALMDAALRNDKDKIEFLIRAGENGREEFIWAMKNDNYYNALNAVKLLIELGADVNAKDSEGISVLTYAMLYGKNDIADLLRVAGAKE